MRWRIVVSVVVLLGLLPAAPGRADTSPPACPGVIGEERLTDRIVELTIDSVAMGGPQKARLLLPAGFDPSADHGWPALYLLHGAWGDQASWTGYLAPLEDEDVIVVMPDGGTVGWYSDWYNGGAGGPPRWETFHLVELRSILERCYRADGRYAVAGLSMGGFGALSYAARHPDLFVAAASYSGAVHTRAGEPVAPLVLTGLNGIESGSPDGVWGNFLLDEVRWRAHNPVDLAPNMKGLSLFVSSGDGRSGPLDPAGGLPIDVVESGVYLMNVELATRLRSLGISFTADFYGPGRHQWAYWARELERSERMLVDALERPHRPRPASFSYRSAEKAFEIWGWQFAAGAAQPAFTDISVSGDTVSAHGFGLLTVVTPPRFKPGRRYIVHRSEGDLTVTADTEGRVSFTLDLDGSSLEVYTVAPDLPGPRPVLRSRTATIELLHNGHKRS